MISFRPLILLCIILFSLSSCDTLHKKEGSPPDVSFIFHEWNAIAKEAMVADGFSPLLASRTFAYPNVAAYEVLAKGYKDYPPLAGKLNGLDEVPQPDGGKKYSFELAAAKAYAVVSKKLVYNDKGWEELLQKHVAFFRDSMRMKEEVIARSLDYGNAVGEKILAWANEDGYPQTKAMPKYLFSSDPGKWIPTPPEFRSALEPYWGTLRTISGISPDENSVPFTIPFSTKKGSDFYNLVMTVYEKSKVVTEEETTIALYWDDNPDQMTFDGHIPVPRRRISPPAHWITITERACLQAQLPVMETMRCYAMVSVAIADALICCWKEKYKTNLVRPVTFIRDHIDPEWMPLIVTPNFPEHTSGHASVSFSSATALEEFFGKNFAFTDSSLVPFGLKERSFQSLEQAAAEAMMSRFYGGIHYMTGLEGGRQQGIKTAQHVGNLFRKK